MHTTIFSKIIRREIPAEIVYEDEQTIAFLDIAPNNPGHTLVVPKAVYENVFDVTEDTWTSVMRTVHHLAPIVRGAVGATGINIMVNNGTAAGQVVPHLHVHLIPRVEADGYTHWPGKVYAEGEMQRIGKRIRKNMIDYEQHRP